MVKEKIENILYSAGIPTDLCEEIAEEICKQITCPIDCPDCIDMINEKDRYKQALERIVDCQSYETAYTCKNCEYEQLEKRSDCYEAIAKQALNPKSGRE